VHCCNKSMPPEYRNCVRAGEAVKAEGLDSQLSDIVGRMELAQAWQVQVVDARNSLDENGNSLGGRARIGETLRRLKKLYMDLEPEESEYVAERSRLELALAPTAVAQEEVTRQAGHYHRKGARNRSSRSMIPPRKRGYPVGRGGNTPLGRWGFCE
jgi:hypothetical protein